MRAPFSTHRGAERSQGHPASEPTGPVIADQLIDRALHETAEGGRPDVVRALADAIVGLYGGSAYLRGRLDAGDHAVLSERLPGLLDAFKAAIAGSARVTSGAKQLVSAADRTDAALRTVLADKAARETLREIAGIGARRALEDLDHPVQLTAGVGAAGSLSELTFGEACRRHDVSFSALEHSDLTLEYESRSSGSSHSIQLTQLAYQLADASKERQIRDVCDGLLRAGMHFVLVLLHAGVQSGRLKLHPTLAPQFRVFAIRALLSLNAIDTAYREAVALAEDEHSVALLSEGERRRLENLIARAGMRSGRADALLERSTDGFVRDPSPDRFRVLLSLAAVSDPRLAETLCQTAVTGAIPLGASDKVFVGELLRGYGRPDLAITIAQQLLTGGKPARDSHLLLANAGRGLGNEVMWRAGVEQFFAGQELPVRFTGEGDLRPFGFVAADDFTTYDHPPVTVVMTTFNAAATLRDAVQSVLAQTFANLELIIVDDASTDRTRELIAALEAEDPRVVSILKTDNEGTYVAKNAGMRVARGEFVTFHDSDDWMHPRRIERQVSALSSGVACSTSRWIRMDGDGMAIVRRGGPFVHQNPASTLFRRSALERLGYFDPVRTGADSEMLARLRATLGAGSLRDLDDCLGIGLHHENSLTRSGPAAFDEYRYSPVRIAYWESWLRWHVIRYADGASLFNDGAADLPYDVPESIRP